MRIAARIQMLPRDVRDVVCRSLGAGSPYRGVRDKFRVSRGDSGPNPMDVGVVGDDHTALASATAAEIKAISPRVCPQRW